MSLIKQFQFPLWLGVSNNNACGIQRTLSFGPRSCCWVGVLPARLEPLFSRPTLVRGAACTFANMDSIPCEAEGCLSLLDMATWLTGLIHYGFSNVSFFHSLYHSPLSSQRIKSKQDMRCTSCLRLALVGSQACCSGKRQNIFLSSVCS